ncbi:SLC13 family permease [Aestuariivirga sp.]|uniref:SLC13 family permease n=1 Tax=Aestuariivirga sp. TaxID=2650926 RepID=UPI00391B2BFC
MTAEIMTCLAILGAAVVLFSWDRVPADVVGLGVLLAVIATGLVPAEKALAGFGSGTVVMILGFFIMTAALSHTGIVDTVGQWILGRVGDRPFLMLGIVMVAVSSLSAFISNTAATAFFVPVVLGMAARSGTSPSRLLLPLAFASILSSSVSLISTSTNIVISELMVRAGEPRMGMFELAPVGIPIAVLGIAYMLTLGLRLMPDRARDAAAPEEVGNRDYAADLVVTEDSPLVGTALEDSPVGKDTGFRIMRLLRNGKPVTGKATALLEAGDVIVVEGRRRDLLRVKDISGLDLKADLHLADDAEEENPIVEGVLMPDSPLIGHTLKSAEFYERYGLKVLGLNRAGFRMPRRLSRTRMRLGDVLLLQGPPEAVKELERGNMFNIFGGVDTERLRTSHAALAITIFAVVLLAISFNLVAMPVAALGGAFLMLLTGCISPEEAYRRVEWKVLILIGALLSLGVAMDQTGTGRWLATQLIAVLGGESPLLLLSCFFVLTVALTQPMSNQAAAIVVVPIAFETARQLGLDPRSFAMMIAIAASCSYLTPLEPSSLMVYGPGKYRFMDFVKVGFPLTFLIFGIALLLVPVFWPLGG